MDCPSCKRKLEMTSLSKAKWENIWGGRVRCNKCHSWIRKDRRSLILINSVALVSPFLLFGALSFDLGAAAQVTALIGISALLYTTYRQQKWEVIENGTGA
jgi:hypothetical protein